MRGTPIILRTGVLAGAVFLISFLALSFNLRTIPIANGWIDPFLHTGAQDEAAYTHSAIRMIEQGDWMNPMLLGRYVLEKPPLLLWMSAASMKVLGIGPFTARLPAVLMGSLIATLCFLIGRSTRSTLAGIAAALLCLSNQLLFTMSRLNMTDILLTATVTTALGVLVWDPALIRRGPCFLFMLAIAAGILTKSIAGLLPALAALLFASVMNRPPWPQLRRTVLLTGTAILLASPWFLYQFIVHRQWFMADQYFQLVLVGIQQHSSLASHLQFYSLRGLNAAPVTILMLFTAIPALIVAIRRREPLALLLTCFFVVLTGALFTFRYESVTYLTPLLPILILIAVVASPLLSNRVSAPMCAVILIVFAIKIANSDKTWGISYQPESTVPAAAILHFYCEQHRDNGLYILGVEDQFYALALPLARVRYGWVDPAGEIAHVRPHLSYLGVVQDAAATPNAAVYAARLREWGLDSVEPLGTAITGRTMDHLAALVLAHPESDFLVSPGIAATLGGRQTQDIRSRGTDCVLLESRLSRTVAAAHRTCGM